jgi:hypothetical protein
MGGEYAMGGVEWRGEGIDVVVGAEAGGMNEDSDKEGECNYGS